MWTPTHVHVIVHRAENLLIKGKNGTNNSFVVIELGKDSYRTSVKEKSGQSVIWNEECELKIPKAGNTAAIELTAFHRNTLGLDQFLGAVKIPLMTFDKYQKSIQWYKLQGKTGKEKGKDKQRGELEVQIGFISKVQSQSLTSLQFKGKKSFNKLTGSLFSLKSSDKKIGGRKLVNTLGRIVLNKKKKDFESSEILEENTEKNNYDNKSANQHNLDPGVISDEEDSGSRMSLESYTNEISTLKTPPPKPLQLLSKNPEISISQWEDSNRKLSPSNTSQESVCSTESKKHKANTEILRGRLTDRRLSISCVDFSHLLSPKPEKKFSSSLQLEKSQEPQKKLSKLAKKLKSFHSIDRKEVKRTLSNAELCVDEPTPKSEFKNKNKDELINMVVDLQKRVNSVSVRVKDLENYLDDILAKVMETVPKILEKY